MNSSPDERDPVEELAEEFVERLRGGEHPSLTEYVNRCPERADEIRELFPALVAMEKLKPAKDEVPTRFEPAQPEDNRLSDQLGDYRIIREIGRGGMGVVYEAEQVSLGRHVALKVLPAAAMLNPMYLLRFRREARSAAKLHHTNIVPVFGVGEHDGVHFYAMQYIEGETLERVLKDLRQRRNQGSMGVLPSERPAGTLTDTVLQGVVPQALQVTGLVAGETPVRHEPGGSAGAQRVDDNPSSASSVSSEVAPSRTSNREFYLRAARIGVQVADALAYAHRQGVLHRDIKPSNLLLDALGIVWVTDFGLAKAQGGEELTDTGDIVGTLRYMAPERFEGTSLPQGDVYSLGLTLYELLALRPGFDESNRHQLIEQVMRGSIFPPSHFDPGIPRDLETIVLKCLARDPNERYCRAEDLAEDLRLFLADRPIQARRAAWHERLRRWCRRNPTLAAMSASILILLVVIAVGASVSSLKLRSALSDSQANLGRAEQAENDVREQLARTEQAERRQRVELARSLQAQASALQRSGLIGRRFASLDRIAQSARELRNLPQGRESLPALRDDAIAALGLSDLRVAWQRKVDLLADASCDPKLEQFALVPHNLRTVEVHGFADHSLAHIAVDPGLNAWHVDTAFSPDGRHLLVRLYLRNSSDYALQLWQLDRKEHAGTVDHPARADQSPLANYRLAAGALVMNVRAAPMEGPIAFHPDCRRLYFAVNGAIVEWDIPQAREKRRFPISFRPFQLCLDPSGNKLAVNSLTFPDHQVVILDVEKGAELELWTSGVGDGGLAWSDDGRFLAIGQAYGKVHVWDVGGKRRVSVMEGHHTWVRKCAFAPASSLLATTTWDGTTRLWDAASGKVLLAAPGRFLRFSPTGDRLAFYDDESIGVWEVAHAGEMRTLLPGVGGNRIDDTDHHVSVDADFSPDGGLLVLASDEGARLFDAPSGTEVAHVQSGYTETVRFFGGGKALLTCGPRGVYRWPLTFDEMGRLGEVGPPVLLREYPDGASRCKATLLPGDRGVAIVDNPNARVCILDLDHPNPATSKGRVLPAGANHRMTSVSVSPDGCWAAAGGWKELGIYVWDLRKPGSSPRLLQPAGDKGDTRVTVRFSPDNRFLVSCSHQSLRTSGYYFWEVGTWERVRFVPYDEGNGGDWGWGAPVFTRDGRWAAMNVSQDRVQVMDVETGEVVARLSALSDLVPTPVAFSSDGTRLVAVTNRRAVLLWDLRAIRTALRWVDLDLEAPPFPPGTTTTPHAAGVRVHGAVMQPRLRREWEHAAAKLRLSINPLDARANALLGWSHLRAKDEDRALGHFSKAIEGGCTDPEVYFERGLLLYKRNRHKEASDDFTGCLERYPRHDEAYHLRGHCQEELNQPRLAVEDFTAALELKPDDVHLLQVRAKNHVQLKQYDRAITDLRRALAIGTEHATLNSLAWILVTGPIELRNNEEGLRLAQRAVEVNNANPLYLTTLGIAQYRAGKYREAVETLERGLTLDRGSRDGYNLFFLAMCHASLGDMDGARSRLKQAIEWAAAKKNLPPHIIEELKNIRTEAEATLKNEPELPPPARS